MADGSWEKPDQPGNVPRIIGAKIDNCMPVLIRYDNLYLLAVQSVANQFNYSLHFQGNMTAVKDKNLIVFCRKQFFDQDSSGKIAAADDEYRIH